MPDITKWFETLPAYQHWATFQAAAKKYGLNPNLLAAVSLAESGGGTTSQTYLGYGGGSGPQGIPQPQYAGWSRQIYDAAQLLSSNIKKYGKRNALAAYTAGPGNIAGGQAYATNVLRYTSELHVATGVHHKKARGNQPPVIGGIGDFFGGLGNTIEHHNPLDTPGNVATAAKQHNPANELGQIGNSLGQVGNFFSKVTNFFGSIKDHPWIAIIALIAFVLLLSSAASLAKGASGGTPVPVPV